MFKVQIDDDYEVETVLHSLTGFVLSSVRARVSYFQGSWQSFDLD